MCVSLRGPGPLRQVLEFEVAVVQGVVLHLSSSTDTRPHRSPRRKSSTRQKVPSPIIEEAARAVDHLQVRGDRTHRIIEIRHLGDVEARAIRARDVHTSGFVAVVEAVACSPP